ncbi:MAG: MBOAT family protein [Planctomycetes bacterium]|nr:MBOAT family protein [Planctomycetota bacterium]
MLFSSPLFVFLFLPIVLGVYFVVRPSLRNAWLLAASLFFYAWGENVLLALMLLSIVLNWLFGLWLDRARQRGSATHVVVWATIVNIGLLVLFKYADWIWDSFGLLLVGVGAREVPLPTLGSFLPVDSMLRAVFLTDKGGIRLPIGISFFTFQAFSYVLDVHRNDAPVQKKLSDFALYVTLFPQLIAGPIVRYKDVAGQIVQRVVTRAGFAYGIRRFVVGLAKKMLVANLCAKSCDPIFAIPAEELTTPLAWLGIVCYSLQIYFDFSGYSDMAIGLGKMFGFTFLENFDFPYIARSITEFWRRWHISLSTWFRDYLYIPLGGSRVAPLRTYVNLLTVFVFCGLWHGASFSFLFWGLWHGAFLVLERAFLGKALERSPRALRHAYTLLAVVIGWVFFRADTLGHARAYLKALFAITTGDAHLQPFGMYSDALLATAVAAGIVGAIPWVRAVLAWRARLETAGRARAVLGFELAGLLGVCALFYLSALELAGRSYNPFIYFRF